MGVDTQLPSWQRLVIVIVDLNSEFGSIFSSTDLVL